MRPPKAPTMTPARGAARREGEEQLELFRDLKVAHACERAEANSANGRYCVRLSTEQMATQDADVNLPRPGPTG